MPVAQRPQTGPIQMSNSPLRPGGNSFSGEFFEGRIDEVRVYNRALNATDIQTDMNRPVATSSPTIILIGTKTIGPVTDSNPQGVAEAFQAYAGSTVTGTVTNLSVYVNAGSTATELVAGLYKDYNGHPGTLPAQAALTSPSSAIRCMEVGPVKRVLRAALLACRVPGPPVPSTTRGAYRRMGPGNDSPPSSVPSTQIRSPEETARTRGGPPKPVPTTLTNLPTTSTTISPLRRGCGLRPWSGLSSPETRSRYCYALLRNHFS